MDRQNFLTMSGVAAVAGAAVSSAHDDGTVH